VVVQLVLVQPDVFEPEELLAFLQLLKVDALVGSFHLDLLVALR
jgi:hypothetical protein